VTAPVARRTLLRAGGVLAVAATLAPTLLGGTAWAQSTIPAGMTRRKLASGRTYLIRARLATSPGPVVIGLHGTALTAQSCNDTFWTTGQLSTTGWVKHAAASSRDYTLVLGEAVAGNWNVGNGWPSGTQDDDKYLLDVVADVLARQSNADSGSVFVAGFSAGGAMAWRAAALYPQTFAACGSLSGWTRIYPRTPIDCWHHHGTADATVPIRGGVGANGYTFPPAYLEAENAVRGSRVVMYSTSAGHLVPAWTADRLWEFWTVTRSRP
jgi:poly(3-hydroxybutyrate) depolymerase